MTVVHSAKIPPTPTPTHTSTGFILSGMKAIGKQNQCDCQAGNQFTEECGGERRGGHQGVFIETHQEPEELSF